ncbi:hypothetical protein GSbR_11120 [Geobacter sp. SVR]|nr:hypothetical protein GSVR_14350 [Geobacter sp. SVR]GCF84512.1 hypothetical protein GSbR_11120 [Geobacter sp. SVR]
MAESLAGAGAVVTVNTEENRALAARFGVKGIPALFLLKNGHIIAQISGTRSTESILSWIHQHQRQSGTP